MDVAAGAGVIRHRAGPRGDRLAKDQALCAGMTGRGDIAGKERKTGRGERDSPATNDLPLTMRLAESPEPCDWLRSA